MCSGCVIAMIRLLAATVAALVPASVAGFDPAAEEGQQALDKVRADLEARIDAMNAGLSPEEAALEAERRAARESRLVAIKSRLDALAHNLSGVADKSLDASPRRTYFGPNRHNQALLAAFVAHHGRAEVASRVDVTYLSCAQS